MSREIVLTDFDDYILNYIAQFLAPLDAYNLRNVCHRLRQIFGNTLSNRAQILRRAFRANVGPISREIVDILACEMMTVTFTDKMGCGIHHYVNCLEHIIGIQHILDMSDAQFRYIFFYPYPFGTAMDFAFIHGSPHSGPRMNVRRYCIRWAILRAIRSRFDDANMQTLHLLCDESEDMDISHVRIMIDVAPIFTNIAKRDVHIKLFETRRSWITFIEQLFKEYDHNYWGSGDNHFEMMHLYLAAILEQYAPMWCDPGSAVYAAIDARVARNAAQRIQHQMYLLEQLWSALGIAREQGYRGIRKMTYGAIYTDYDGWLPSWNQARISRQSLETSFARIDELCPDYWCVLPDYFNIWHSSHYFATFLSDLEEHGEHSRRMFREMEEYAHNYGDFVTNHQFRYFCENCAIFYYIAGAHIADDVPPIIAQGIAKVLAKIEKHEGEPCDPYLHIMKHSIHSAIIIYLARIIRHYIQTRDVRKLSREHRVAQKLVYTTYFARTFASKWIKWRAKGINIIGLAQEIYDNPAKFSVDRAHFLAVLPPKIRAKFE